MAVEALCGAFNEPGAPGHTTLHAGRIDVRIAPQTSVKSRHPITRTLRNLGPAQSPKDRHHGAVTSFKVLIAHIFRFHPRKRADSLAYSAGHDLTMGGVRTRIGAPPPVRVRLTAKQFPLYRGFVGQVNS